MKATVIASLFAAANADSLTLTFKDCGAKHAVTKDVQPTTLNLGEATSITGSGSLDKEVSGGTYDMELKAGGGLIDSHFTGNNCDKKEFDLPLGIGKLTWEGISCPLAAADSVDINFEVQLAASLPPALATSDIHLGANDQDGESVLCVDLHLAKAADFDAYLNKFGKAYNGDDEYTSRKAIYEANMKWIAAENKKGHSFTLGETRFTDMTNEEYKTKFVSGYKAPSQMLGGLPYLGEHEGEESSGSVDWTTKGAVTAVKDQGQCGSCWSFSTTGGLEGAWQISSGQLVSMSEQQFVDCDKSSMGCNGGNMNTAFEWAEKQTVATEQSYPYTAKDGTCKTSGLSTAIPKGGVTGYKSVGSLFFKATVAKLESAIDLNPVSIAIEADQSSFQHYTGGILDSGCGTNLDHGVLAVGYNTADGYWLVKNSWGSSWGDNGYIKLSQTGNVCGILNQPVYPTVSSSVSV